MQIENTVLFCAARDIQEEQDRKQEDEKYADAAGAIHDEPPENTHPILKTYACIIERTP